MTKLPFSDPNPPRWVEYLLRVVLAPQDHDTIAGDLLEEYREVVLPTSGRLRAQGWYLRQALSLVSISKSAVVGAIGWIGMAAVMLFAIMRWVGPHGLISPSLLVFAAMAFSINGLLGIPLVRFAFLCRSSLGFGALFGLVIGTRYVLDAFWPTSNYIARSIDMSVAVIWIAFLAGVWGAWKSAHVRTGALVAMTASITGWIMSLGVAAFIALRQSTSILTSLTSDDEILAVSLILVAVAAVMGTTGAMFGRGLHGFVPQRLQTARPR